MKRENRLLLEAYKKSTCSNAKAELDRLVWAISEVSRASVGEPPIPEPHREGEGKAARAIKRYMPLYYNEMKNSGDKCENVIEDLKREATRIRNQNTHIGA